MLTQEEIEEFRKLWKEEFGEDISYQEAHDRAVEVATLFEMLAERKSSLLHNDSHAES